MKVLVVGSGAREHCLADKLAQSRLVDKIYSAPGNGGTAELGQNVDIKADDIKGLADFAFTKRIDLTVVGPEIPLAKGIVDWFKGKNLPVFGPSQNLARLESSKVFAKELMKRFNIPTPNFEVFTLPGEAKKYIKKREAPMVIKADGLAAGKGVLVCKNKEEASRAVDELMVEERFGQSGKTIIIEDYLQGEEFSLLVLTDGKTILPLVASQDHKRAFDNDQGPNTGGMGAYAPTPLVDKKRLVQAQETVFKPLIEGLKKENKEYKGVLYGGFMVVEGKAYVLEFNVRFGDPEAQVILPKLKGDLFEVMLKINESRLDQVKIEWDQRSCVCVVLASGGYPGKYQKGKEIRGIKEAEEIKDVFIYQAGTKKIKNSRGQPVLLTDGGRVLSVVGLAETIKEAKKKVYQAVERIDFKGIQYRKDIGDKAFRLEKQLKS